MPVGLLSLPSIPPLLFRLFPLQVNPLNPLFPPPPFAFPPSLSPLAQREEERDHLTRVQVDQVFHLALSVNSTLNKKEE